MMTDPSERRRLAQALDRRRADLRGAIDANAPRATLEAATARLHETRRALREADGLTAQAVNLLADLMAWSVTTNEGLVRSMFGRIT